LLIRIGVPVIAIFTKMDALEVKAYSELLNMGKSFEDANQEKVALARDMFQQSYLDPLKKVKNGPAQIVELRGVWRFCVVVHWTQSPLRYEPACQGL
jgi:hypothetical protein